MEKAGREVRKYQGRYFWKGYGCDVDRYEFQDVCRETKVRLQTDQMGLGLIVYPVQSMTDEEYENGA